MRVLLRPLLLGAITVATAPALVEAQPPPTVDKTKVAKQYVEAGLAAKDAGDYDTAITLYMKAYQLVPRPLLIFNMAEANRLAGRLDQALAQYADYLAKEPNGIRAQAARDNIKQIEAAQAADARKAEETRKATEPRRADDARKPEEGRKPEAARKADDARKPEAARSADDAPRAAETRKADDARKLEAVRSADQARTAEHTAPGSQERVAELSQAEPRPGPTDEPPRPGRTQRLAGIAIGVAGVVTVGVGVGFGLQAKGLADQVSKSYDPEKVREGEHANRVAIAGFVTGPLLIAGGAALYWWGYTQGNRDRLVITPVLSPQLAGLAISGQLP